ncbi:MFS family major facilitator transporter [Xenorhabdus mauleonii]|uniref:MFS family major facilitator transporter n=1 Tax=Xenorhabdus mauleonii TaxID=351675 RepID=A0A1I3UR94_9GAMM|nr:MFS transporter [Xenorhabdus mauleonii]PHM39628.1 MFS family major facilitator transporter [Xenorhabdus mauleonii]SFJ84341.1 Predicted arabinose efflux permease, MFS family [Xenorhabdus mauleonii]
MIIAEEGRWKDLFSSKNAPSAIALSLGVGLMATNTLIAITILPSVVNDIGGLNLYAWNTTLFVMASIIGSILSAKLLSVSGARNAYLIAALIFLIGSLSCTVAPTMEMMLVGRTIQGLGGGFLFALSYAMINLVFEESLWTRAMALISGVWGVATLIGPAIGGIFAEMNAWRYAFGIMVPIILLYAIFTYMILPKKQEQDKTNTPLPFVQLILLAAAVLAVSSGSLSQDVRMNILGIAVAVILVSLLVIYERRTSARLLPENALSLRSPHLILFLTILLLVVGLSCDVFIPYFLQILHGQSPLVSGYMVATAALGWTIGEMASASWQGAKMRFAIMSGPVFMFLGMLLLLVLLPNPSAGEWQTILAIVLGLGIFGFGIGFGWPHLLTRILQVSSDADKNIAGSSITTVQLFATAFGSALGGMIVNLFGFYQPGGVEGASTSSHWLLLFFAITPILALLTASKAAKIKEGK